MVVWACVEGAGFAYDGPLVIGEDLMSFIIDDKVSIYRGAR